MNGRNPLLPASICIPDGEAHVMSDGKVYLYGSCDKLTDGYCSGSYYTAWSSDMKNWSISEIPSFSAEKVPWAKQGGSRKHSSLSNVKSFDDLPAHIRTLLPEEARNVPVEEIIAAIEQHSTAGLPEEIRLYAPDAIEKNGKTYLYFCCSDDTEGVAVSDSPQGPFENPVQFPVDGIDPAVFIDQDGSAYLYWGQFEANAAKLSDDMMHIDEDSIVRGIVTEQEHHFHEGSSMRRRGDTYYYVFADTSRGKPSCLGYATSDSPLGPFQYQGVIIDNSECDPECWNIHGSIEEVNGQWYVFYHRPSNHSPYLRRACCEPIHFDESGLIQEVKMTSQGAGDPFTLNEKIKAFYACAYHGEAHLDTLSQSSPCIRMKKGSETVWRYVSLSSEAKSLSVYGSKGNISVFADQNLIGTGNVNETIEIGLPKGVYEITVRCDCDEQRIDSLIIS